MGELKEAVKQYGSMPYSHGQDFFSRYRGKEKLSGGFESKIMSWLCRHSQGTSLKCDGQQERKYKGA